jgi:hypothetical protein
MDEGVASFARFLARVRKEVRIALFEATALSRWDGELSATRVLKVALAHSSELSERFHEAGGRFLERAPATSRWSDGGGASPAGDVVAGSTLRAAIDRLAGWRDGGGGEPGGNRGRPIGLAELALAVLVSDPALGAAVLPDGEKRDAFLGELRRLAGREA